MFLMDDGGCSKICCACDCGDRWYLSFWGHLCIFHLYVELPVYDFLRWKMILHPPPMSWPCVFTTRTVTSHESSTLFCSAPFPNPLSASCTPATWAEYHCDGIIRRDAVPDEDFRANMVETREQIVADRHKHADETGLERVSSSYRRERRGCWRVSNLTNFLRNQEEKQSMPFCEWLRLSAEHSTPNTEDLKFPILKVSMEVDPRNDCRPAVGSLYNLWKAFGGVIWELPPES